METILKRYIYEEYADMSRPKTIRWPHMEKVIEKGETKLIPVKNKHTGQISYYKKLTYPIIKVKKGVVISTGAGLVGWAICHDEDEWNEKTLMDIAISRCTTNPPPVPANYEKYVENMKKRSKIYFKK